MRHPVDNPNFGSPFGPRKSNVPGASTNHLGQDYRHGVGTPVKAIADGTVINRFYTGPGGWWILVQRPNGDIFGGCHLNEKPPVGIGEKVREGQNIAHVGNTGTATSGPHLHFTVRVNGEYVDPRRYIDGGSLTTPITPPQEEDDMYTPEDRTRDQETNAKVKWIADRVGGTKDDPNLTEESRYLKGRLGGLRQGVSITDMLRSILNGK